MALAGYDVVVSIATAATASVYSAFDGIINFTIGDANDMLDITDFADGRFRRRIAGLRDINISLDGDLETAATAFQKLQASYAAGQLVGVSISTASGAANANFYTMLVESIERKASVDGKVEVSISMQHEGSTAPFVSGTGL